MHLPLLPPDWAAVVGGKFLDPNNIVTVPSIDDIHRELGLDYEERLEAFINQEISAPFGRFSAFTSASSSIDLPLDNVLGHLFNDEDNHDILDDWYDNLDGDLFDPEEVEDDQPQRKQRSPNIFGYIFGDVHSSNWHRKFLADDVREQTRILARRDRFGEFRSHFRVTFEKFEYLVDLFLSNGWIRRTKHCRDDHTLRVKAELLILSCLNILGNSTPFRQLTASTNISFSEHRHFFHLFIDKLYSVRDNYIFLPRNELELSKITDRYKAQGLPGAMGSKDVVHTKWSNCPTGDLNRAKGKESYPSIAFQVISDYDRRIQAISSAQFSTHNDKHIVKIDKN